MAASKPRRPLPNELCAELVACIPPFPLKYGGTADDRKGCLSGAEAIPPISTVFDELRRKRFPRGIKKISSWLHVLALLPMHNNELCMTSRSFAILAHFLLHEAKQRVLESSYLEMGYKILDEDWAKEWPDSPLPENIVGIDFLELCYYDATVLPFLTRIRQALLGRQLFIHVAQLEYNPGNVIAIQSVLPMLMDNDENNKFYAAIFLDDFSEIVANLPQLMTTGCKELRIYNNGNKSDALKLAHWLSNSNMDDGTPKLLTLTGCTSKSKQRQTAETLINRIIKDFRNATLPSSFMLNINIPYDIEINKFHEENSLTNEELWMERRNPRPSNHLFREETLIIRCVNSATKNTDRNKTKQCMIMSYNEKTCNASTLEFRVKQIGHMD